MGLFFSLFDLIFDFLNQKVKNKPGERRKLIEKRYNYYQMLINFINQENPDASLEYEWQSESINSEERRKQNDQQISSITD